MVKIRLKRMGAKKVPFYRIIVADSRTPRDGKAIAELGYYDPTKNPMVLNVDVDGARKWINNGAQPTETVRSLLKKAGVYAKDAFDTKDVSDTKDAPDTKYASDTLDTNEGLE